MKKTIVVGVTSGIAAYKAIDLIASLKREGLDIFVIMTMQASKMVSPEEFVRVSGHKVFLDLFEEGFDYRKILKSRTVDHIELADKADLLVIVPATANTIAKIAHGLADDFLTTTLLAVTAPVIVCPAMNVNMWHNPVVKKNMQRLRELGFQIVEPEAGMLACGYAGVGRLADIHKIRDTIIERLSYADSLKGKKILITAGGTIEKIDDVRFIANRSSGKMGVALAEACFLRGADVLLLKAKTAVKSRYLIPDSVFNTTDELTQLIRDTVANYDVIIHCAAVADFSIAKPLAGKVSSKKTVTLRLKPRTKILDQIKRLNPKIILIAFKAEYGLDPKDLVDTAFNRLQESQADAIVANDISQPDRGFESDKNEVVIILKNGETHTIPHADKHLIAAQIIDYLLPQLTALQPKNLII